MSAFQLVEAPRQQLACVLCVISALTLLVNHHEAYKLYCICNVKDVISPKWVDCSRWLTNPLSNTLFADVVEVN